MKSHCVSLLIWSIRNKDGVNLKELRYKVIASPMMMIRTPATIWRIREKEMSVRTAM